MGGLSAQAARWRITPSVAASESYTNNVNLATGNTKQVSDFITTLTPGVGVSAQGGRVNLNLDYSADQTLYKRESGRDDLSHNLTASGTAELWKQQLFFDANAAIFRQVINPTLATSATPGVNAVNSADTTSFTGGPRFLHHFGPYVSTVSTITYSDVSSTPTNGATAAGNLSTAALTAANQSTKVLSETFQATSGRAFTQLQWSATAQESKTDRGADLPGIDSKTANTNYTYIISRKYALLAGLGWQHIRDNSLAQQIHGVTWSAGFRLTPGPRTSLSVNYNHRDNSQFFSFNGSYRLSSRTTFTTSYDQSLTFSQQQVANGLAFLGVAPDGTFIDTRTGLPFNPTTQNFALQNQTARTTTFTAGLQGTRGRNTFNVLFSHADQMTDATGADQVTNNASLTWTRQINRRTSGTLGFNYQITDQTQGVATAGPVTSNRLVGTASLAYQLTETATASLSLNTSRLDSSDPTLNTNETAVTVSLRKTF